MGRYEALDTLLTELNQAHWKERDAIKATLQATAESLSPRDSVIEALEEGMKSLNLEARWEVEEVIEALTPAPEPEPEAAAEVEEAPEEAPTGQLSSSDLNLVYNDPRGILLHKSKVGDRWFLTQRDPYSGQPQTMELDPMQVEQIKGQLKGSPYWVLGSGVTPA